ncbi:hypothetical protein GCM10010361_67350 [Streptomyces olivaceiscleroticus]|uniref:Uncharacterized protein n=1 Tax=Streptomyces olivaceiscleroticus TaxID=68245 RepID=A0ABN1B8N3_9ACTN
MAKGGQDRRPERGRSPQAPEPSGVCHRGDRDRQVLSVTEAAGDRQVLSVTKATGDRQVLSVTKATGTSAKCSTAWPTAPM